MKIYSLMGYLVIAAYLLACMYSAPAHLGPWAGILIGGAYLIFCWFMGGLYLADVLHMGIAHRALDCEERFIKAVTVVNNVFAIYVNPMLDHNVPRARGRRGAALHLNKTRN